MKNLPKINLTSLTCILLAASSFCAAHPESKKSFSGTLDEKFAKADTDSDELISKDEFFALQKRRIEKRFAKIDLNKDNQLSKEEMIESFSHMNRRTEKK